MILRNILISTIVLYLLSILLKSSNLSLLTNYHLRNKSILLQNPTTFIYSE